MTTRGLAIVAITLALLAGGCATQATGSASPAPSATVSPTPQPTASTAAAPSPTETPTPTATPVPATTPVPPATTEEWTRIAWRQLANDDPMARIRVLTPWQGGYIGRGDPVSIDGGPPANGDGDVHTPFWASTDGRTWTELGADTFGSSKIVVGTGATADGLVALTVPVGPTVREEEDESLFWPVTGPLESWTSPDGTTWTSHPLPDLDGLAGTAVTAEDMDRLQSSMGVLLIERRSRPPLVTTDGITWERSSASGLPKPYRVGTIKGLKSGFVATRDDAIVTSSDGREWTNRELPTPCTANEGAAFGRDGIVATGTGAGDGSGVFPWTWCRSVDGRTWRQLKKLQPLGFMDDADDQECRDACPDGTLIGDGLRMIAYRGWGDDQAGWTSFDGRTWQPIAFDGRPERSSGWLDDTCTQSLVLLPMGLRCTTTDEAVWFGEPGS